MNPEIKPIVIKSNGWNSILNINKDEDENINRFLPTRLIRIKDMKIIEGDEISKVQLYSTLSYSWSQVGEIYKEEKDKAIHKFYDKGKILEKINFKQLIQCICKNLDISYLWMDQLCIKQNDKNDKKREIKNMHNIYRNAKYTIVLIPELINNNSFFNKLLNIKNIESKISIIKKSIWYTRIWTLEETFLSKSLIFIGEDMILLSKLDSNYKNRKEYKRIIDLIYSSEDFNDFMSEEITANMVFRRSHYRKTTNEEDFIFGLMNLFNIDRNKYIGTNNDNVKNMLILFHGEIINIDPSILCFGYKDVKTSNNTISSGKYSLPSWTGQNGYHVLGIVKKIGNSYIKNIECNILYIKSEFVTCKAIKTKKNQINAGYL